MLSIDQYAYSNRLKQVHPLEKFILAITLLLVCLTANSMFLSLVIILLMTLATVILAKIPGRYFIKLMLMPSAFLLIGVLTIVISIGGDPSGYWRSITVAGGEIGMRYQDLILARTLICKSLGAVSCLYFLALTTPMVDLIWVLKKMKVPELFLEIMGLMYRFIFVLLETAGQIHISQASRLGYASIRTSYVSLGSLIANLFSKSLHRSRELTVAMQARCYTDAVNVLENEYSYSKRNLILIALINALVIFLALYI